MSTENELPHADFRRLLKDTDVRDVDLAEAAGVTHSTVYRWRVGRSNASREHMARVCNRIRESLYRDGERVRGVLDELDKEMIRA